MTPVQHPDPRVAAITGAAVGVGATACAVVLAAVSVKLIVGLFA